VGYVFQFAALFDSMTVADNLALGLRRRGLEDEEIEERVQEALALVDLSGTGERMPAELSGGMRKRVVSPVRSRCDRGTSSTMSRPRASTPSPPR